MAVPLLHEERALGVLEVLDRPQQTPFTLQEMELLGLFANQAAIALDLLLKARAAERLLGGGAASSRSSPASRPPWTRSRTSGARPGLRLLERARRRRSARRAATEGPGRLYIAPGPS